MKIVDMHCDTISRLLELEEGEQQELRENTGHLDLRRMKQAGYLLQNFALFVELVQGRDPWEQVLKLFERYRQEMENNQDLIAPVLCFEDIAANEAAGKLSALLTVEEGAVCRGELEKLQKLYDMGVRMLTLTWNFPNELGYPNRVGELAEVGREAYLHTPNVTEGLTERGREFVTRMEELGMIPDVSHLSDRGFYDVLEVTQKPFVASHSDARAVCSNVRNMTDDMMGGIEVLGLGSDFDGIDTHEELPGAESMGRLWDAMKAAGFTERELDLVFSGNVLRVYGDTLKK